MRKPIIILCLSLSLVIILEQFNLWDSLLLFLLVGTIPGTSWALPPFAMLAGLTFGVVFASLVVLSHATASPKTAEKTLPKKRYSRI